MINLAKRIKFTRKGWFLLLFSFLVLFFLPIVSIFFGLSNPTGDSWKRVYQYYLDDYIYNSLFLVVSVSIVSLIIGVSTAWIIANYTFPFSKFFKLALLLPLSIPSYIMAYTYNGIFDSTGTFQVFLKSWFSQETANKYYFDFLTPFWLVILLSLCLYPYIYSACLISFSRDNARHSEVAKTMGVSTIRRFLKIDIPMAKVAIFAGLFLVIMEVLNEYGAVQYFNLKTFTSGIFGAWEEGDLNTSVRLATILLMVAFVFIIIEKWSTRKLTFNASNSVSRTKTKLKGWKMWLAIKLCSVIFVVGFFIPFIQLISWSTLAKNAWDSDFFAVLSNSSIISIFASIIIVFCATLLFYAGLKSKLLAGKFLSNLGTLGYAIPGAILAVGIIIPFAILDKSFPSSNLLLGTAVGLVVAYLIRFVGVAFTPVKSGFQKQGALLDDISHSSGKNGLSTLIKVHFPILKGTLITASILVFIDILKELPITLILRPTNYESLSTLAYTAAQINESAVNSAVPSIAIIVLGAIPLLLLNKVIKI